MHNFLKIFELYINIVEQNTKNRKDDIIFENLINAHDLRYIALFIYIEEKIYNNIKNIINTKIC